MYEIRVVNKNRLLDAAQKVRPEVKTITVYIGRPSVLGNPFRIGEHGDRAGVIQLYREWLQDELNHNSDLAVFKELQKLLNLADQGDLQLVCWCAPEACHGDVLKEWLEARR